MLPFPRPTGDPGGLVGAPCREKPTLLTFGAGVAAVSRQQRGPGTGRHGAVLLHVLAVHFPHGLPPVVSLLWGPRRPQERRAKMCQAILMCAKSCHPGTAWLPPSLSIWSPRHLAQSPDACTAAKPGPPPHSPQPPDQLCMAPPAPASGSCSGGEARRPSSRRGRKNEA